MKEKPDAVYNRQPSGRFGAGNNANPRGPKPKPDFLRICEAEALAEGVDLHDAVWRVAKKLLDQAAEGDVVAAKLILDRLCGLTGRGTVVGVGAGAAPTEPGPHPPEGDDLAEYLREMNRAAGELLPLSSAPVIDEGTSLAVDAP